VGFILTSVIDENGSCFYLDFKNVNLLSFSFEVVINTDCHSGITLLKVGWLATSNKQTKITRVEYNCNS
jgi:hypothetical protein